MKTLFEIRMAIEAKKLAARTIIEKAQSEARAFTAEETASLDTLKSEMGELGRRAQTFEAADEFRAATPEEQRNGGPGGVELPELNGKHKYSVIRALRMQWDRREGRLNTFNGLEAEVHQQLMTNRDHGSETQGVLIPWNLGTPSPSERRDVTTTTAAGGLANILGAPMIEFLRNRMVMPLMGATVLTGLIGATFSLPKQTAAETAYHVGEAGAPSNSNLTLGLVTWTPRSIAARSIITRKTLIQTSLDVEALVRRSILLSIAREFDRVAINGSGAGNIPLGILQDPNVPTVALGANGLAPTWNMLLALESAVATANADFGKLGYVTSNKGRAALKSATKLASSQYSDFLWQAGSMPGEGEVNSYRALSSEQVPSNFTKGSGSALTAAIFGNFESATYGLWSGIDMVLDPYTGSDQGAIKLTAFQDYDLQFQYESGFAKCVDVITP